MSNVKLLDCTLRDGGYVNDWEFGQDNLVTILERLINGNVDIIEVGFLDQRREFDINRSIMPNTGCVQKIYGKVDKKDSMIVAMIDYGTCGIENLQRCEESYLDGIRVIFKKHMMHEAIAFCREVKALGYKVFTQAVSITSYSDEELKELITLVNQLEPYAVSMVDTYGLLYKDNLLHYFELMDQYLDLGIGLGYHSHNNFQLAYSNCMEVIRKKLKREVVVDATLYGMGKSAGNAPIELVSMYLNETYGKKYDNNQLLEAIDGSIMRLYKKYGWGYNFFFYISASNHCHPNYVQYLMDKHTLSIKSINEILDKIEPEKKLLYNQDCIEQLYYEYQKEEFDDNKDRKKLSGELTGKKILILGPGKTLALEKTKIKEYILEDKPIVISINHIPEFYKVDYVFLSNARRYIHLLNVLQDEANINVKVIATSNVTKTKGKFSYNLNNSVLLDYKAEIIDNSFVMLLKVLAEMPAEEIICAGLDGYSKTEENYLNSDMEYWFTRRKADELNEYVKRQLPIIRSKIKVNFLTKTYYDE